MPVIGVALLVGCDGGVMSAGDMRKYAIRRTPDVEVKLAPAAPQSPAADKNSAANKAELTEPANIAVDASPSPPMPTSETNAPSAAPAELASREEAIAPTASTERLDDRQSPTLTPLDPEARARRTVENLKRIGAAFEAYQKDKGVYPTRAIFDDKGTPLLSWRVALLPYLGYEELYARFGLEEPWNSRRNSELLARIPEVYRSPDRADERTNYVVPVASSTIFGHSRGVPASSIEDGPANTVLLLEADDAVAVPWTQPNDYELNLAAPTKHIGSLRGDSLYVVWGGGEVGRVPITAPRDSLRAMFTFDSGENFVAGQLDQPLFAAFERHRNASQTSNSANAPEPSDRALGSLADEYLRRSAEAFSLGHEQEGLQWFYAAAVVAPPGGSWAERYRWVPALRRPVPLLRFGVGLEYRGPRERAVREATLTSTPQRSGAAPKSWSTVTGELGQQIVKQLSSHCEKCGDELIPVASAMKPAAGRQIPRPASLLQSGHGVLMAPGVYFLTVARQPVLMQVARREAVDVLLLVDWRDVGHKWSAGITLFDVVRGEVLLKLPRIQSTELQESRTDPLAHNPLVETLRQLDQYLEDQLTPQRFPEQIRPQHVARRLDALAALGSEENPLRVLAEMRYYSELGLADQSQLLLAYQALAGRKPGSILILGGASAKSELLKPWLPIENSTIAGGDLSRRNNDDE